MVLIEPRADRVYRLVLLYYTTGYKQNFLGGDCIPKGQECDVRIYVTYFVVYTVVYAVAFILITNINDTITMLKTLVLKKKSVTNDIDQKEEEKEEDSIPVGGVVQIIVLFFQVAGFLQVSITQRLIGTAFNPRPLIDYVIT